MRSALVIVLCMAIVSQAHARMTGRAEASIYSNLCEDQDTGDEDGMRITLLRFADGDFLALQYAEGAAHTPVIAPVKFDRMGHFSAELSDGDEHFKLHGFADPAKMVAFVSVNGAKPGKEILRRAQGKEAMKDCVVVARFGKGHGD